MFMPDEKLSAEFRFLRKVGDELITCAICSLKFTINHWIVAVLSLTLWKPPRHRHAEEAAISNSKLVVILRKMTV